MGGGGRRCLGEGLVAMGGDTSVEGEVTFFSADTTTSDRQRFAGLRGLNDEEDVLKEREREIN